MLENHRRRTGAFAAALVAAGRTVFEEVVLLELDELLEEEMEEVTVLVTVEVTV